MKSKTRKAAVKRIKVKKNGLEHKKAFKAHLLRRKNSKRLRRLSEINFIHSSDKKVFSNNVTLFSFNLRISKNFERSRQITITIMVRVKRGNVAAKRRKNI
jgi:large subunit ribosomal protein L35